MIDLNLKFLNKGMVQKESFYDCPKRKSERDAVEKLQRTLYSESFGILYSKWSTHWNRIVE